MPKFHPIRISRPNLETSEQEIQPNLVQKNFDLLGQIVNQLATTVGNAGSSSGGGGVATSIKQEEFFAYNTLGPTFLSTSFVDLPVNVEVKKDFIYEHNPSSAEVTVNKSGLHEVIFDAGFSLNPGDVVELEFFVDTGSGYVSVPGTLAYCSVPS